MVVNGAVAVFGMVLFVTFVFCGINIWIHRDK